MITGAPLSVYLSSFELAPEIGFKAHSLDKLPCKKLSRYLKAFSSYPIVKMSNNEGDNADNADTNPG